MRNIPLKYHQSLTHLIVTGAHTNRNNVKSMSSKNMSRLIGNKVTYYKSSNAVGNLLEYQLLSHLVGQVKRQRIDYQITYLTHKI